MCKAIVHFFCSGDNLTFSPLSPQNHVMDISLPPHLDQYVAHQMASGLYRDASEVIAEALRQKINHETWSNESLEALLHREVMLGWDQAERGECTPLDLEALKRTLDAEHRG